MCFPLLLYLTCDTFCADTPLEDVYLLMEGDSEEPSVWYWGVHSLSVCGKHCFEAQGSSHERGDKTPALWDVYTLLCGWTGVGREMTSNNDIKCGSLIGVMGKTSQGKWDRECWGVEVEGYRFSGWSGRLTVEVTFSKGLKS